MLLQRTRGRTGTEGKRGKRVRRDEGRKEDDVTKDASEQFAKGVTRANRKGECWEKDKMELNHRFLFPGWKLNVGRIMEDAIKTDKDFCEEEQNDVKQSVADTSFYDEVELLR